MLPVVWIQVILLVEVRIQQDESGSDWFWFRIRVHQIFEMQIVNHHMLRERVEITKMIFIYFYSVSST